jgi:type IV pilus assembly protein PilC
MKTYKYIARDLSGAKKQGLKQAGSSNDVLTYLREQGCVPVSVEEYVESPAESAKKQGARRRRIKAADLATFCWQFSAMIEGGIGITTALETISDDLENAYLQQVLRKIAERINKGDTLLGAISQFPRVFNSLARAIIMAGESSGSLAASMKRLAEYYEDRDKLMKKVRSATAYPIFVISFITLLLIVIMTFIIPRFRSIFEQIGGKLPGFTRAFMAVYDVIWSHCLYFIGGLVLVIIFSILAYTKTRKGHRFFSQAYLKLPLLGKVFSQAFISMFCRTMATLLTAGVSVLEVFDILLEMTRNDVIKEAIIKTKNNIIEGQSVSTSMALSDFFPNMVIKMTKVGEESGTMANVLEKTADYYERKVEATVATVISLVEPIMIVSIGAIVLVVVLALYLPIFTMSDVSK